MGPRWATQIDGYSEKLSRIREIIIVGSLHRGVEKHTPSSNSSCSNPSETQN
jgi:hypothetical protein